MGPPWLGLLHYNLHKRGTGKRPRFREESQGESPPRRRSPEMPRDREAPAHRVIWCHNLAFSLV